MNIRLKALLLSGSLALSCFVTMPAMADESNKRIDFQFSAPVQIPGHTLAAGKYVFQLLESPSDRNMVQVFSEDAESNENLVATLLAIPDYTSNTPEKPIIHFQEVHSGSPEAIQSWFYPGDNTGWEFVYAKSLEADATTTPELAPVAIAAVPTMPPAQAQHVQETEPAPEIAAEKQVFVAQNDAPPQPPAQDTDIQTSTMTVLPETGENSDLELISGLAMSGGGAATVFVSHSQVAGLK